MSKIRLSDYLLVDARKIDWVKVDMAGPNATDDEWTLTCGMGEKQFFISGSKCEMLNLIDKIEQLTNKDNDKH